jgi:hypothetical protein
VWQRIRTSVAGSVAGNGRYKPLSDADVNAYLVGRGVARQSSLR